MVVKQRGKFLSRNCPHPTIAGIQTETKKPNPSETRAESFAPTGSLTFYFLVWNTHNEQNFVCIIIITNNIMKLSIAAIILAASATGTASISTKVLMDRMKNGQVNKKTLMNKARQLESQDQEGEEEGGFEVTGDYSITFNSCKSVSVYDQDLFDASVISHVADNEITSQKSYIVFDAKSSADGTSKQFMTTIQGYVESLIEYLPEQVESYCETCEQYQEYCEQVANGEEVEEQQQQAYQYAGNGGNRQLSTQTIDCDTCEAYLCFADDEDEMDEVQQAYAQGYAQGYNSGYSAYADQNADYNVEEYDYRSGMIDSAIGWVKDMTACNKVNGALIFNNLPVYASFSCNAAGTGISVGTFLDDRCTMETNVVSYQYFMSQYEEQYYTTSKSFLESLFTDSFDCSQTEIQYVGYDYEAEAQEQGEAEEQDEEVTEANDYCKNLFEAEEVADLENCDYEDEGDEREEEEEAEAEEAEIEYDWYVFSPPLYIRKYSTDPSSPNNLHPFFITQVHL